MNSVPKRLCYICEATEGGVRKHLLDLLRVFLRDEQGLEISCILGDRGEAGFRSELEAIKAAHPQLRYEFLPDFQREIRPLKDWRAYRGIKRCLREFKPDIVHTHSSKAGFLGREAARALGIRNVIHTAHVFPFQWSSGLRARLFLALERRAASASRAIVCVSESQREDALKRGLCAATKLIVVRNAIPPETVAPLSREAARSRLNLSDGARVVGMVARLAPQKGVGVFLRAAAEVLRARPETIFVLIGGGPLESEMRERVRTTLPITTARSLSNAIGEGGQRFRLLGFRADAEALYAAFDVLVLSSLYEGLPYVLLEAMSRGVPVVATDVLGSRDVVADGETGLLARVNDPSDIAAKIIELLDDPEKLKRLGSAAKKRVASEFSFDEFVRGHRELY